LLAAAIARGMIEPSVEGDSEEERLKRMRAATAKHMAIAARHQQQVQSSQTPEGTLTRLHPCITSSQSWHEKRLYAKRSKI